MKSEDKQAAEVWQQAINFVRVQDTSGAIKPFYIISGFLGTCVVMLILALPTIIQYWDMSLLHDLF